MRVGSQSQTITRIGPLQVGIIVLVVATAFNHLSRSRERAACGSSSNALLAQLHWVSVFGGMSLHTAIGSDTKNCSLGPDWIHCTHHCVVGGNHSR